MSLTGKTLSILLILVMAAGAVPWASAPPPAQTAAYPTHLLSAANHADAPASLTTRDTPAELLTWLVRRTPLSAALAGAAPLASFNGAICSSPCQPDDSPRHPRAEQSLVSLHSQLTV